jgi:hypothetical protein
VNLQLAQLAFWRAVPRGYWIAWFLVAAVTIATQRGALSELPADVDAAGTVRSGAWIALALCIVPWIVLRAASQVAGWRAKEVEWLAKSPESPVSIATSAFAGILAAGCVLIALSAVAVELATPAGNVKLRRIGALEPDGLVGIHSERTVYHWRLDVPESPPGASLRVHLAFVPTDAYADVEWRAERAGHSNVATARVSSSCTVDVALPTGPGPVQVELRRVGGGGLVLLDERNVDHLAPVASERFASVTVALKLACATAAWIALALGFGSTLAPWLATLALLATTIAFELLRIREPWGSLPEILELCSRGIVPEPPSLALLRPVAILVVCGIWLAGIGARRRRRRS